MPTQPSRNDSEQIQTLPVKLVRKDLYRDLIALSAQDLLVFFGSFGIALFALGIYNITTVDSKG